MLNESYLRHGLNALSRSHATNYFMDGHRGGAMVSAYFLCGEQDLEAGAAEIIASTIDAHWTHTDLCAPFPEEEPDVALLGRIVTALEGNISRLRQAGHNVILPTLALKGFSRLPEMVTPAWVEGICRLIECFDTAEDIALDEDDPVPDFDEPGAMAEFILSETLRTMQAFIGRGQGWSGHMLTYGRALIDLAELGYGELAARAHHAFKLYVTRTRQGPLATDKPRPEHARSPLRPLERAYWREWKGREVGIGHCFKYPYGFYGLMQLARDSDLKQRCLDECYHIF